MIRRTSSSLAAIIVAGASLVATPAALAAVPAASNAAAPNCSTTCFWDKPNYQGHRTVVPINIGQCHVSSTQIRSIDNHVRGVVLNVFRGRSCGDFTHPIATTENGPVASIPSGNYAYSETR